MTSSKRLVLIGCLIVLCGILLTSFIPSWPQYLFPLQPKPEKSTQRVYDYYLIVDELDGHTIMYVPLIAQIGDEVLSEENKLYVVVRIEENRAYARFVKNIQLSHP
ncbi:MAG: stage II sporulation protein P [Pelosinus sp.]|nr:stage II sporulation protein P [Pelosinus sp.]